MSVFVFGQILQFHTLLNFFYSKLKVGRYQSKMFLVSGKVLTTVSDRTEIVTSDDPLSNFNNRHQQFVLICIRCTNKFNDLKYYPACYYFQ